MAAARGRKFWEMKDFHLGLGRPPAAGPGPAKLIENGPENMLGIKLNQNYWVERPTYLFHISWLRVTVRWESALPRASHRKSESSHRKSEGTNSTIERRTTKRFGIICYDGNKNQECLGPRITQWDLVRNHELFINLWCVEKCSSSFQKVPQTF